MKRNMILIIGILFLISCKEQKEQAAKFLIDASKMSRQTKYFYKYDSDKLISQTEKTYTIMFGQVVDSIFEVTHYEYNNKGLLIKEISKQDWEENSRFRLFEYNTNDSLVRDLYIEPENDTTFWDEYDYYPDGRKIVFQRLLFLHFDPNQDFNESIENQQFDTTLYRISYEYKDDFCQSKKRFDLNENLIKKINYEYIDDRLAKEIHYSYIGSMELIEKTKIYDYSKSIMHPEFYSLDSINDTVELCFNEFRNKSLITRTEIYEYGNIIDKSFFENELVIGMIGIDKKMNYKIVDSYEYFKNGDLKEMKSYQE